MARVSAKEVLNIPKMPEPLTDNNWSLWKDRIKRILELCEVDAYALGQIPKPTRGNDQEERNWKYNDNYAAVIISNNITATQMIHVGQCSTANTMWSNLEAVHEMKGHQTVMEVLCNIFQSIAKDDTDIDQHLTKLKVNWDRLNAIDNNEYKILLGQFKVLITSSLPRMWDAFTEPYVGGQKGVPETDPKKLLNVPHFIGIL
jgi:hypothetical protein